jgi:hypothetical protein
MLPAGHPQTEPHHYGLAPPEAMRSGGTTPAPRYWLTPAVTLPISGGSFLLTETRPAKAGAAKRQVNRFSRPGDSWVTLRRLHAPLDESVDGCPLFGSERLTTIPKAPPTQAVCDILLCC